ncbi:hypothetical protein [Hellea balneolensis]|uniref:hypothetical protein n=1 Tax=Hellea balneolensis TaxID=287478 RepID=UPI0012B6B574|nr:hypothetical protein [Hellea balneolensis]
MTTFKTLSATGFVALFMAAPTAFAAENTADTKTVKSENTQVLAAVETANVIPVQDEDGQVFYNHYVDDSELFDASLDFETVDTYTFEYEGRIYTNKIVTE